MNMNKKNELKATIELLIESKAGDLVTDTEMLNILIEFGTVMVDEDHEAYSWWSDCLSDIPGDDHIKTLSTINNVLHHITTKYDAVGYDDLGDEYGWYFVNAETDMPVFFKSYLASLLREYKDELWSWLDGTPDAVEQMIKIIGKI